MILLQDPLLIKEGAEQLERITNPILAILIGMFLLIIVFEYLYFTARVKEYITIIKEKDIVIQDLNKVLQEVRTSDAALIVELRNTLVRFTETDKDHTNKLDIVSSLLQQLVTKIDLWIKVYNK